MKMHRLNKAVLACAVTGTMLLGAVSAQSNTLDAVQKVGEQRHTAAKASQVKIDRLSDETRDLLNDYKAVMKQVDGLKVYNSRLERQINDQNRRLGQIEKAISDVTVVQRQIPDLLVKMIDGLEQFVAMDLPFKLDERNERIEFLRNNLDRSDITNAERFRQVLEAYKIENEYGRRLDAYKSTVNINGVDTEVDILQVGRVALMYQTTDKATTGAWNKESGQWEVLDSGEYRNSVRQGINMAKKTVTIDILKLPVHAPEAQ